MRVRAKPGMTGFIYGSLRTGDPDKSGVVKGFTLRPINHSVDVDDDGKPVVITPKQQFSAVWMERLDSDPEEVPAVKKPYEMKVDELTEELEGAGIEIPEEAKRPDLIALLDEHRAG